jgi:hypothetical protein
MISGVHSPQDDLAGGGLLHSALAQSDQSNNVTESPQRTSAPRPVPVPVPVSELEPEPETDHRKGSALEGFFGGEQAAAAAAPALEAAASATGTAAADSLSDFFS